MAYWHCVMCNNLKPLKIDDEDPPSILKQKIKKNLFICHMLLCKLLIFTVIYE